MAGELIRRQPGRRGGPDRFSAGPSSRHHRRPSWTPHAVGPCRSFSDRASPSHRDSTKADMTRLENAAVVSLTPTCRRLCVTTLGWQTPAQAVNGDQLGPGRGPGRGRPRWTRVSRTPAGRCRRALAAERGSNSSPWSHCRPRTAAAAPSLWLGRPASPEPGHPTWASGRPAPRSAEARRTPGRTRPLLPPGRLPPR